MIYDTLASYYDDLVKDDQATQAWVDWILSQSQPCSMLELACGSGEITHALSSLGYRMDALDLSPEMIARAKEKDQRIHFFCQDMTNLENMGQYDVIACLCDSFNYILSIESVDQLFQQVHQHLNSGGLFFFDTHSLDRLEEFKQEWNETGTFMDGLSYQWSISSEDDWLYQDFAFYFPDGTVSLEHHLQRVYQPEELEAHMEPYFEIIDVKTDFDQEGITSGEKYFYIVRKKEIK